MISPNQYIAIDQRPTIIRRPSLISEYQQVVLPKKEEEKKPNWIMLGAIAFGAYLLLKK